MTYDYIKRLFVHYLWTIFFRLGSGQVRGTKVHDHHELWLRAARRD